MNIQDTNDWEEDGPLGNDEAYAVAVPHNNELLNKALGLEEITLRFTKEMYSNIEYLSNLYGVSKQVLIKKAIDKMIEDGLHSYYIPEEINKDEKE